MDPWFGSKDPRISFERGVYYGSVGIDSECNIFLLGKAGGVCDLDPGRRFEQHTASSDKGDMLLSKFDASGAYQWSRIWDGGNWNYGANLVIDPQGEILIAGYFSDTFDLDPGPGVDEHTAVNNRSGFLIKLDSKGEYEFGYSWQGGLSDLATDASGNIYVKGGVEEGVQDLDPGPGVDVIDLARVGSFLSKFDSDGTYRWSVAWGPLTAPKVAIGPEGEIYVAGSFSGTVDLDPGPGTFNRTSYAEGGDIYLVKLDSSGRFLTADTWGKEERSEDVKDIAVDSTGRVFVTGSSSISIHLGGCCWGGESMAYLACFDSNGAHVRTHLWEKESSGEQLAVDPSDNLHLCGHFGGTTDFDPSAGIALKSERSVHGARFLCTFESNGGFQRVRTWDHRLRFGDVACGPAGDVYITGDWIAAVNPFLLILEGPPSPGGQEKTGALAPQLDVDAPAEWTVTFGQCFLDEEDQHNQYWGSAHEMRNSRDYVNGLAVDGNGDLYVAGVLGGEVDFSALPDATEAWLDTERSQKTAFVSKFRSDGGFEWVRKWGPGIAFDVDVGPDNSVHVTGDFFRAGVFDLDPTSGVDEREVYSGPDGFVCKLSSDGGYVWGRTFGRPGLKTLGDCVAVDSSGNVFIGGAAATGSSTPSSATEGMDFDPTPFFSGGGSYANFVAKLSPDGEFEWSADWPGEYGRAHWIRSYGVDTDSQGNVCFTAKTFGNKLIDFDPDSGSAARMTANAYLVSLDSQGRYRWAWPWEGQNYPAIQKVVIGPDDHVFLSGERVYVESSQTSPSLHYQGPFIAEFDREGNLLSMNHWGRDGLGSHSCAADIAVAPSGGVYFVGHATSSYQVSPAPGTWFEGRTRTVDVVLGRLDSPGSLPSMTIWGKGTYLEAGRGIEIDSSGRIYVAGVASGIFLMKLLPEDQW